MADRAIAVAVLEGDFAAISLSLQLQSCDLKLSEAMWTAKSSSSGFSVSLYWPSGSHNVLHFVVILVVLALGRFLRLLFLLGFTGASLSKQLTCT